MSVRYITTHVALGLSLMVAPVWLSAQEKEEKAPTSTELERTLSGIDRIELMKRGLDSNQSLQPGGSQDFVPTVSGEAQTLPGKPIDLGDGDSTDSEKTAAWKSQNWLVAGMNALTEGDATNDALETDESLEAKPSQGSAEFWLELAMGENEEDTKTEQSASSDHLRQTDQLKTVNPLEGFMTDWLSAEELARVDLSDSSGNSLPREPTASLGQDLDIGQMDRMLQSADSPSTTVAVPELRGPNPYLDIDRDTSALSDLSSILPPPGASTRSENSLLRPLPNPIRPVSGPVRNAAPSTEVKEPWKPPVKEDEKYFRRLNRF